MRFEEEKETTRLKKTGIILLKRRKKSVREGVEIGIIGKLREVLAKISGTEEEGNEEVEEVTLEELLEEIKKERKEWRREQENLLKVQFGEMRKAAEKVMEGLEELENAKLRNPNLTMKEKQFMKGNREHYIQLTKAFLKKTLIEIDEFTKEKKEETPSADTITDRTERFRKNFNSRIGTLRKATQRNFMVLQDFFKNEVSHVARVLSHLEKQTAALGSIIRHREEEKRAELEKETSELLAKFREEEKNKREIRRLKSEEKILSRNAREEREKLDGYKKGEEYKNYTKLRGELDDARRELTLLKIEIKNRISAVEKALRKYTHISMDSRATEDLLKDPFGFITRNTDKSREILLNLANAIETGQIDFKDKRREKSLKAARELGSEYIKTASGKGRAFLEKIEVLEKKVAESPARKNLSEMEGRIGKLEDEMKRIASERKKVEEALFKERLKEELSSLEKKANSVLKRKNGIRVVSPKKQIREKKTSSELS